MPTDPPPLLGGYVAPPLKAGDQVHCRYRQAWCRVTSWATPGGATPAASTGSHRRTRS